MGLERPKIADWQEFLDKLKQRMSSRVLRTLNFPSRVILIKSILQAMPTYLFSVLAAPKAILKQIRSIQRKFIWGSSGEKAKFSLVSWEDVCKPKDQGGLGLRDPKIMSEILGAKIWW